MANTLVSAPYSVAIVLDTAFGSRLFELAARMPVWIVDTPPNLAAVKEQWRTHPAQSEAEGVTTFKVDPKETAEAWCADILYMVDLHHGEYSHDPPYSAIEVIGAPLTGALREAFAEYGLFDFVEHEGGFRATKATKTV